MTKAELRGIYLEKQKSLSDIQRTVRTRRIGSRFFENFDLRGVRCLHVFLSIEKNREIETSIILKRIWKEFPAVATVASRVDFETMKLENIRLTPQTELLENRWQIPEPVSGEFVEVKKIDVCLVPLLCFDRKGFRVGYGKGFYDVFLSRCRKDCLKIGLSYFAPVAEISDVQEFDVKLDFCVTPETVLSFEKRIVNEET